MTKSHSSSRSALGLLIAAFLANGALGCEAQDCDNEETGAEGVCLKSLKRFDTPDETDSVTYTSGGDIVIDSPNGDVHVVPGDSGSVTATFQPFVLRAYDTTPEEAQEDLDSLERSITLDADDVWIDVTRPDGSPSSLGADIIVFVPPEFDGTLDLRQANGHTEVDFVGGAVGVLVTSENGGCDVAAGDAAEISIECDNGDISASIDTVTDQSGSGFSTGNGAIRLSLPSDQVFSVQAAALAGGTVTAENLPSACVLNGDADSAKTLVCNGATTDNPIYQVEADGTSLADVVLAF
jgi:hypothetical protein